MTIWTLPESYTNEWEQSRRALSRYQHVYSCTTCLNIHTTLQFAHTVVLHVPYESHNKQQIFPLNNISTITFVMDTLCSLWGRIPLFTPEAVTKPCRPFCILAVYKLKAHTRHRTSLQHQCLPTVFFHFQQDQQLPAGASRCSSSVVTTAVPRHWCNVVLAGFPPTHHQVINWWCEVRSEGLMWQSCPSKMWCGLASSWKVNTSNAMNTSIRACRCFRTAATDHWWSKGKQFITAFPSQKIVPAVFPTDGALFISSSFGMSHGAIPSIDDWIRS